MKAQVIRFAIERCRRRSSVGMRNEFFATLAPGFDTDHHVYGVRYFAAGL